MNLPAKATELPAVSRRTVVEAVIASTIGTTIEWYDFFLYGTMAALIFPRLFFPQADPFTAQILSFGTFTVGFLARPLGGVVFGYMGDRMGRKAALVSTLLLMGVSTLAIGFLPTYEQIGVLAPVSLTVLRFVQGLGVGGEWGGAVLLALEYGHRGRRGFFASWPQAGVPLGSLASTGIVHLCLTSLSAEQFNDWGWRVPFYLSGLLIVVGLLIRMRILETPLFAALKEQNLVAEAPVSETLRLYWRELLLIAGTRIAENSCFYIFTAWIISYDREVLKLPTGVMLQAVNLASGVEFFTIPLFGMMSDRLTRRGIYMAGCALLLLFAWPFFALLETREPWLVRLAVVLAVAGAHAMLYSVQASLIPELFSTRLRCTGASIGYQLGAPLAGGLAPLIAASLLKWSGQQYWPIAIYLMVLAAISLACVLSLTETSNKDIAAGDAPPRA